ncbi:MAG TPA: response regulator transcription factor [Steroidobacteraceae bacterium]|nr:response regulator transcription factor [Steroidobacteraceae bacterium]
MSILNCTRVLLVDDHSVVREGYRRLLEGEAGITVVGEAADAARACEYALALDPDVVVMDIGLPGVSGIDAMRRMLAHRPGLRVLIFSMHDDAIFCSRALQAGALGYLSKSSAPETLVQAVQTIARGEQYLSPDLARNLAQSTAPDRRAVLETLTAREFEVLRLLARGETLARIAEKLGVSEKTVANHQSAVREKLGMRNGVQLARFAEQLGVL